VADNSVGTNQILDESIQSVDLAANSVGSAEIASGAVGLFEMQPNSVGPAQLGLEVVSVTHGLLSGGVDTILAACPAGKRVIAGGYRLNFYGAGGGDINVRSNGPTGLTGWTVVASWSTSNTWNWTGYAVCIIDGS
jgi:hypothetical protein